MAEWRAYDQIEPIGGYREDYRMAQVCLMLHNLIQMQRGDGNWEKADLNDFMLWGPETRAPATDKRQSVEEMKAVLSAIPGIKKKEK